jgi:hypothetical protein
MFVPVRLGTVLFAAILRSQRRDKHEAGGRGAEDGIAVWCDMNKVMALRRAHKARPGHGGRLRIGITLQILNLVLPAAMSLGNTYYVSTNGLDSNPGSDGLPWRTIQKGVDVAQPGDRVWVRSGAYDERVTTKRGGNGEEARIEFRAEAGVAMRGWIVNHPYLRIGGFDITGHSAASVLDAHVKVNSGGDFLHLVGNVVRDGVYMVGTNIYFHDNGAEADTITSAGGEFLAARFQPGQTLYIGRAVRYDSPPNSGTRLIQSVTEDTITVSGSLVDEGPASVYLSASLMYGLVVSMGADNCRIESNVFRNLAYDSWFVGGATNVFSANRIEASHGWDAMHFMGQDNIFVSNIILNSPLVVYQVSPDVFENWASIKYERIVFSHNFIQGFAGVLASQKGAAGDSSSLTFTHNVFVDVGSFYIRYPGTTYENNTFVDVSTENNPVAAALLHPIVFDESHTEDAVLINNIFVGCGYGGSPDTRGWYELGDPASAAVGNNFVAGPSPDFSPKAGFVEGVPELNGGDPGFVNMGNPLGPDGIPFSADDGLQLRGESKLRGVGVGGVDLGAYNTAIPAPILTIVDGCDGPVVVWSRTAIGFNLQQSWTDLVDWSNSAVPVTATGSLFEVRLDATNSAELFRLAK